MFTPSSIAAIQLLCCVVDYRTRERTFRVDSEPITTTKTNPTRYGLYNAWYRETTTRFAAYVLPRTI